MKMARVFANLSLLTKYFEGVFNSPVFGGFKNEVAR